MRLMQVKKGRNGRQIVATEGDESWFVDGFESAIAASGEILSGPFPPARGDENELNDHLVEI